MKTIGQNIAYYRKQKNLTQEDIAELCNVTPQAVSKWENDGACPDVTLLKTLARRFGITVDSLLDDGEEPVVNYLPEGVNIEKCILRIKVNTGDGDKVSVNFPVKVFEVLLSNENFNMTLFAGSSGDLFKTIDFKKIIELISMGALGKLIEVDSADGDKVDIYVEQI